MSNMGYDGVSENRHSNDMDDWFVHDESVMTMVFFSLFSLFAVWFNDVWGNICTPHCKIRWIRIIV